MNTMKEMYVKEVAPALMQKFQYKSSMQIPRIDKIVVKRHGKVRRAKLYYLRERTGKAARIKEIRRG